MAHTFRCDCPITSALDVLGDKWTLVIVKQMLIDGKKTFKEFVEAEEAIATNILTDRLKKIEEKGIIKRLSLPENKKSKHYHLTEKGLGLTPVILEMAIWSDGNLRDLHPDLSTENPIEYIKLNKASFVNILQERYKERISQTQY